VIFELEHITHCEIEVTALPLSAIEELVEKGYKAISTAVVPRPRAKSVVTRKTPLAIDVQSIVDSEVSVTAQIPLSSMAPDPSLESKFAALCRLLIKKGVVTEAELLDALKKSDS